MKYCIISENDKIIDNISVIEKQLEEERQLIIKPEKHVTTYMNVLKRLENFLSETQESILKRLVKYRYHVITRKNERKIRKNILSIFVPLMNIIKVEYTNLKIGEHSNSTHPTFINSIILRDKRRIVILGNENF